MIGPTSGATPIGPTSGATPIGPTSGATIMAASPNTNTRSSEAPVGVETPRPVTVVDATPALEAVADAMELE